MSSYRFGALPYALDPGVSPGRDSRRRGDFLGHARFEASVARFLPRDRLRPGSTFLVYTTFAALAVVFVLKFVKETKGKELEDMV
jgi:hypothetical protein